MPADLSDLDLLLQAWHKSIATFPPAREFSREAGFFSALSCCAEQLDQTLQKDALR